MITMFVVIQVLWFSFALQEAVGLTDEQYYSMPRLFELDDYDECLGARGAFCLGSFQLSSKRYSPLLNGIQEFSNDKTNFNHTVINRGYCIKTTCAHIDGDSLPHIFEECVHNITKSKYSLDAALLSLDYCKTEGTPSKHPVDTADVAFAVVAGFIVMGNIIGTAYDVFRNTDNKPNRYLMAWSACVNWGRLTATYEKQDPRLYALVPVNGVKTIALIAVIVAHSVLTHHMTYVLNPRFLETANQHPLTTILSNGTVVVQLFIIFTSFLLAYNVLLTIESDPKQKTGLLLWWKVLLHRIVRITPVSMFVVGLTATWWRHASDGPLWSTLVETESTNCRSKWWTHALYVNNLVQPDERCLLPTWFLAVDMQLYVLTSALLLCLVHRPHTAVKVLSGLFILSVLANFAIIYHWDLKTMLFVADPEHMRWQYKGLATFKWYYAAPWSSAPASIMGLLMAFVYYLLRKSDYKIQQNIYFRVLYELSLTTIILWIFGGYLVRDSDSKFMIAIYSTLERPVFSFISSIAMVGLFYNFDMWCRFVSWRGWQILGRMSLSVLMVHWIYNITLLAVKTNLVRTSFFEIGTHSLASIFMTYLTALPLYIFVELPTQKFLQSLIM